jgi:hypothetical protein
MHWDGLTFRDRKRISRQGRQYIYRQFRDRLQNFGIGIGFNERQRAREHQMLYRGASEKNPRIKPSEKTYIFSTSITVHYSSNHRSSSCRLNWDVIWSTSSLKEPLAKFIVTIPRSGRLKAPPSSHNPFQPVKFPHNVSSSEGFSRSPLTAPWHNGSRCWTIQHFYLTYAAHGVFFPQLRCAR